MRIGVVTFWQSADNFGQILQGYALQRALKSMGNAPVLIRTERDQSSLPFSRKIKLFIHGFFHLPYLGSGGKKIRCFQKKYLSCSKKIYKSKGDFQPSDLTYEAVICGSDVVWSEGVGCGEYGELNFLSFVPKPIKKISYAASFGASSLSKEFSEFVKDKIFDFDAISVREDSGIDICSRLGRSDAVSVCDPTLLLKKEDYDILLSSDRRKRSFAYFIGWSTDIPEKEIIEYTLRKKIYYDRLDCQKSKKTLKSVFSKKKTIQDWLASYSSADCIYTNSFHGTIFALLFNKPFLFFPVKGKAQQLNDRILNLLKKTDLLDRVWNPNMSIQEQMEQPIDWNRVNLAVGKWRTFSYDWLKNALEL